MLRWCEVLNRKLRQLKVIISSTNLYTSLPEPLSKMQQQASPAANSSINEEVTDNEVSAASPVTDADIENGTRQFRVDHPPTTFDFMGVSNTAGYTSDDGVVTEHPPGGATGLNVSKHAQLKYNLTFILL